MRTLNDTNLGTRAARLKLEVEKRHWRQIDPKLHLGYRRGRRGGKWSMRGYTGQRHYKLETLGIADDFSDADGEVILSFADAQRRARERFVMMQRSAKGLDPEPSRGKYTVNKCLNDYLAHKDRRSNKFMECCFAVHVRPVLGHLGVREDLTTEILQQWVKDNAAKMPRIHERDYDPDDPENIRKRQFTTNTRWAYFCAALNHAWRKKGIPSDAWDRVETFEDVDARRYRFFTIEECSRLVADARPDFAEVLRGAFVTGARRAELSALRVGDFHEHNRTVHIVYGKGGKQRHVILNEEGVALFRRITEGREKNEYIFLTSRGTRWSNTTLKIMMDEAFDRAGIVVPRGTGLHACRHTYCSWALMSGLSQMALAKNLGHRDTRQIERVYGHLTRDFVREAILRHAPTYGFEEPTVSA
jgi:integrase